VHSGDERTDRDGVEPAGIGNGAAGPLPQKRDEQREIGTVRADRGGGEVLRQLDVAQILFDASLERGAGAGHGASLSSPRESREWPQPVRYDQGRWTPFPRIPCHRSFRFTPWRRERRRGRLSKLRTPRTRIRIPLRE